MRRAWVGVAALAAAGVVTAAVTPQGTAPPAGQGIADTTITIRTTGSVLEFQPTSISARQGTRVRIRYVNNGTLPHNLVVVLDDDDLDGLITAAYAADQTGFVPVADSARMAGYTGLASPGQTVEVTFTMPPPGAYTFICLFPGHANSMMGTLRSLR